jgi:hypothetical protein
VGDLDGSAPVGVYVDVKGKDTYECQPSLYTRPPTYHMCCLLQVRLIIQNSMMADGGLGLTQIEQQSFITSEAGLG